MAKYVNKNETEKVGRRIRELREEKNFLPDDIAWMTGFARTTIDSIENGANTDISHFIEVAKAIGVHPMELLNVPFDLSPRNKLSPNKTDRIFLTSRIKRLTTSSFFNTPKVVQEVVSFLSEETGSKINSTHVSVILKRLTKDGKIEYKKKGRKNLYSLKKKNKMKS